jgi:hypothetical protein
MFAVFRPRAPCYRPRMIVSFSRNYIFIRTRKTASSTIQSVLSESLAPEDVFTRRSQQSHPSLTGKGEPKPPLYTHMRADEILPWLPDGFWERAFKFTAVRHPYERVVSLAHFRWGKRDKIATKPDGHHVRDDFEGELDRLVHRGGYTNFEYYSLGGKPAVDDFIRQENLDADFRRIGEKIGVPIPAPLPHVKSGFRTDKRPAREVLSDEQKGIVFETCRPEFELFGYER